MNDSFRVKEGMERARRFLLEVSDTRAADRDGGALDPISPHYRGDSVTWTAIGPRTSESQTPPEPRVRARYALIGFKNGTGGEGYVL